MEIFGDFFIPPMIPERTRSVRLRFDFDDPVNALSPEEFWDYCAQNDKLQIELVGRNELLITFPKGYENAQKSMKIMGQLYDWEKRYPTGWFFNHLVAYLLPNGLILSPRFSWTEESRFDALSKNQREKLIHICPDFVIELRAMSDSLSDLEAKMTQYMENGARLGWLIDPKSKRVTIYRANSDVEVVENAQRVSGEDVLVNFELDLTEIW